MVSLALMLLALQLTRPPLRVLTASPDERAPLTPRAPWVDPSPHQTKQIFVAPGIHLEVLDWRGRGQPLVFLAGYGNTAHVFDNFAPQFRDRYRVIAITRRGFGSSSRPSGGYENESLVHDVLAVTDSLRLRSPFFVGHSFGGAELNGIAAKHPHAARGLIYLDGGFEFAELYADSVWMNTPFPRPPHAPRYDGSPRADAAYSAELTGPGYPEAEVRSQAARPAGGEPAPTFHADSLAHWLMRGTPSGQLQHISLPTLAIYGVPATVQQKYPFYPRLPSDQRRRAEQRFAVETPRLAHQRSEFRRLVPQARIVEIAGGRHYVFLTNPREVARAIRDFAR